MNAMQIDLCILIGCVIALAATDLWLWRKLKASNALLAKSAKMIADGLKFQTDSAASCYSEAKVVEGALGTRPFFRIVREGFEDSIEVKRYYYIPDDPDDREYKRIHAEEVAEKLNERP